MLQQILLLDVKHLKTQNKTTALHYKIYEGMHVKSLESDDTALINNHKHNANDFI